MAMKPEDAEEYTQSVGQVIAGGWRQIALGQRLGVPQALKLTTEQWVNGRLGGYVKYSVEERKAAVQELAADGRSERDIKGVLGVNRKTVRQDLGKPRGGPKGTSQTSGRQASPAPSGPKGTTAAKPLELITGLAVSDTAREVADHEAQRVARRETRAAVKGARVVVPLPSGEFRLLYADPPWRYDHVVSDSRAIENQYPTMDHEAICKLIVPAAADAVLFLWATSPKLEEAMDVISAWGFTYRTCAVWDKEQIGMGYYFRQQHELLLVAARGDAPVPDPTTRLPSVFRSRRSEHSQKPTFVYGYLEAMYPAFTDADRVELFSRDTRPGWTGWSNEP